MQETSHHVALEKKFAPRKKIGYRGAQLTMPKIDLTPTRNLANVLTDVWQRTPLEFAAVRQSAENALKKRIIRHPNRPPIAVELSALLLKQNDLNRLAKLTEQLHHLIERALDHIVAEKKQLSQQFPEHRRMFPYLRKTKGSHSWQGYSRYDAIITENGIVKFIELNTACPAGFLGVSTAIAEETLSGFQQFQIPQTLKINGYATIPTDTLTTGLLTAERNANIEPGLIAVLNDENQLVHQLGETVAAFARAGREARIINAAELTTKNGHLYHQKNRISLSYNKMRISTPQSPNHCWRDGFEKRYAAFLDATQSENFVSVNNLCAMSIAEDKSLLNHIRSPALRHLFNDDEQQFLNDHIAETIPLNTTPAEWKGQPIDPIDYAKKHPNQFVLKPANEGRGFQVILGATASKTEWETACQQRTNMPMVLQEYFPAATIPVILHQDNKLTPIEMHLTLGLAIMHGKFQGVMSRISTDPITNVARNGRVQAVFTTTDS